VLQPALAAVGLRLSEVALILNTHAHLDHAGGNAEVKRRSGARIYLHPLDLPLARSTEAEVEFTRPRCAPSTFLPRLSRAGGARQAQRRVAAGADAALTDGEAIDLGAGIRLRVLHCPGHTPGHVAYLWESEGILFTADSIQGMGARPGGYPYYFDARAYRRSVAMVSGLGVRMLCLGHAFQGGTLVNHPVRRGGEVTAFLQASLGVADTIHRAVAEALRRRPQGTSGRSPWRRWMSCSTRSPSCGCEAPACRCLRDRRYWRILRRRPPGPTRPDGPPARPGRHRNRHAPRPRESTASRCTGGA